MFEGKVGQGSKYVSTVIQPAFALLAKPRQSRCLRERLSQTSVRVASPPPPNAVVPAFLDAEVFPTQ